MIPPQSTRPMSAAMPIHSPRFLRSFAAAARSGCDIASLGRESLSAGWDLSPDGHRRRGVDYLNRRQSHALSSEPNCHQACFNKGASFLPPHESLEIASKKIVNSHFATFCVIGFFYGDANVGHSRWDGVTGNGGGRDFPRSGGCRTTASTGLMRRTSTDSWHNRAPISAGVGSVQSNLPRSRHLFCRDESIHPKGNESCSRPDVGLLAVSCG